MSNTSDNISPGPNQSDSTIPAPPLEGTFELIDGKWVLVKPKE